MFPVPSDLEDYANEQNNGTAPQLAGLQIPPTSDTRRRLALYLGQLSPQAHARLEEFVGELRKQFSKSDAGLEELVTNFARTLRDFPGAPMPPIPDPATHCLPRPADHEAQERYRHGVAALHELEKLGVQVTMAGDTPRVSGPLTGQAAAIWEARKDMIAEVLKAPGGAGTVTAAFVN